MALYESADLALKLYELRREGRMRDARNWFALRFNPRSFQDVMAVLEDPVWCNKAAEVRESGGARWPLFPK